MNKRGTQLLWRWIAMLSIMALLLAACSPQATPEPTAAATQAPTTAPTEEPTAEPTAEPTPTSAPAVTTVIVDFETDVEVVDGETAVASLGEEAAYNGTRALTSTSEEGEWHTVTVTLPEPVDISQHGKLCFYIFDTTTANAGKAANTVGVRLTDASGASVERFTDNEGVGSNPKTKLNQWTLMCMNTVTFTGIDQTQVASIDFTIYSAGVYHFDDITLLAQGEKLEVKEAPVAEGGEPVTVLVQGFEAEETFYSDYQAEVSLSTEIVHSGESSLMAIGETGEWHAFGAFPEPRPLDASAAAQLCFWIYDTTDKNAGLADNSVGVKLFDASGANQEVWTDHEAAGENPKTVKDEWTQMCLNLEAFDQIDLATLDKIQFSMFHPGTYYVDTIEMVTTGAAVASEPTPVLVQGFEAEETFYSDYQAEVSLSTEIVHSGESSLMAVGETGEWHAFGAFPEPRPLDASAASQLCFWIYDTTDKNAGLADNSVGVKLFDASGANQEVWTDHESAGVNPKTVKDEWTQMCLNLEAFDQIDLATIDKIQFSMFHPGTYYVDTIEIITTTGAEAAEPAAPAAGLDAPVLVQGFEAEETFYSDYQAEVSLSTEIVHSGESSLMAFGESGDWHAFGAFPEPRPLDASAAAQLCFWIYDTTANNDGKAANSVGVKLFDASGANQEVWTDHESAGENPKTVKDEWTQMCLNLEAFDQIDLAAIDKIQFALFWAGTYYVDTIEMK